MESSSLRLHILAPTEFSLRLVATHSKVSKNHPKSPFTSSLLPSVSSSLYTTVVTAILHLTWVALIEYHQVVNHCQTFYNEFF